MAYLNICGFETGDFTEVQQASGNTVAPTFSSTTVRSGGFSLRCNASTLNDNVSVTLSGYAATGLITNYSGATVYHRFYFRFSSNTVFNGATLSLFRSRDTANNAKLTLSLTTTQKILARDAGGTNVTGTTILSPDTWYRIEVKVGTAAAGSGVWEVLINGVSEINSTTANVGSNNNASAQFGFFSGLTSGQVVDFFYDDVAIRDDQYPGAGQVTCLHPIGAGTDTTWTIGAGGDGTHPFTCVDETTPDSDTSYITTTGNGAKSEFDLTNAGSASPSIGASDTINCVKPCAIVRNSSGSANTMQMWNINSGGNTDSTTSNDPGATYVLLAKLYATEFTSGATWTTTKLNALQVGVNKTQTQARAERCTYISAMVDYTPVAAPSGHNPMWLGAQMRGVVIGTGVYKKEPFPFRCTFRAIGASLEPDELWLRRLGRRLGRRRYSHLSQCY